MGSVWLRNAIFISGGEFIPLKQLSTLGMAHCRFVFSNYKMSLVPHSLDRGRACQYASMIVHKTKAKKNYNNHALRVSQSVTY